jgi:hypothetical protein
MRDPVFSHADLTRWCNLFAAPEVHRYESVGHFPPEEIPVDVRGAIETFAHSCFAQGQGATAGESAA